MPFSNSRYHWIVANEKISGIFWDCKRQSSHEIIMSSERKQCPKLILLSKNALVIQNRFWPSNNIWTLYSSICCKKSSYELS